MTGNKVLMIVVLAAFTALWGCSRPPEDVSGSKLQTLESRINKLENDVKSLEVARDQARRQASDFEAKYSEQLAKNAQLVKECESLKATLATRTAERDLTSTQFDDFRKNLRDLVGRADAAAARPHTSSSTTVVTQELPKPKGL